ncbi:hypothetical protein O6H91_15G045000 [Diphasiastrum complanatum]|uniref:Uncharacterized protein n=1 Tax=Diphasiastrum complanatum TaxID=34168 RepID=A0ACC2BHW8_DIPCM|nr:hypothetical protein O6H91_15G045000 [Diphasiastrum complanatum]
MAMQTLSNTETAISGLRLKAAAWAWYLHQGGGEGKRSCSPGVPVKRPSRFRVEALKNYTASGAGAADQLQSVDQTLVVSEKDVSVSVDVEAPSAILDCQLWDCGSSLYDSYELVSLCKNLDCSIIDRLLCAKASEGQDSSPKQIDIPPIISNPLNTHSSPEVSAMFADFTDEPAIEDGRLDVKEEKHCGVHNLCNIIHLLIHLSKCNTPAYRSKFVCD